MVQWGLKLEFSGEGNINGKYTVRRVVEGFNLVFEVLYTVGGGDGEIRRRNCLKVPHVFKGGLGILLGYSSVSGSHLRQRR